MTQESKSRHYDAGAASKLTSSALSGTSALASSFFFFFSEQQIIPALFSSLDEHCSLLRSLEIISWLDRNLKVSELMDKCARGQQAFLSSTAVENVWQHQRPMILWGNPPWYTLLNRKHVICYKTRKSIHPTIYP